MCYIIIISPLPVSALIPGKQARLSSTGWVRDRRLPGKGIPTTNPGHHSQGFIRQMHQNFSGLAIHTRTSLGAYAYLVKLQGAKAGANLGGASPYESAHSTELRRRHILSHNNIDIISLFDQSLTRSINLGGENKVFFVFDLTGFPPVLD